MAVIMKELVTVLLVAKVLLYAVPTATGEAIHITPDNIEGYKASKTVVLINFYADWCRFSQMLKPVFDKAADQVHQQWDNAVLGKVNCDHEKSLCQNMFHINKYPTIKLLRNGQLARKEYRGKRSVEALIEFVQNQLTNPVEVVKLYSDVSREGEGKKASIGFFKTNSSLEYNIYEKAAQVLKDDCKFYAIFDETSEMSPQITFIEHGASDQQYAGTMTNEDEVTRWLSGRCVPLVREITFQNGEELTEEGLPFLILFYNPDDPSTKQLFRRRVEEELLNEKGVVNFVTADGVKFAHPLHHLGKSKKDLPILAIDSFRHMYLFSDFKNINNAGSLKQFVADLHSGKLHREFHHGPDQPQQQQQQQQQQQPPPQQPPESTFKKLRPTSNRYTLLHDEL